VAREEGELAICETLPMHRSAVLLTICTFTAAILMGCGSTEPSGRVPTPDQARAALADSPAPLALLHQQASQLLPGTTRGFETRLGELRGHPVVVNVWASWCGPCKDEFPVLQRASVEYGKSVAFLGVATDDVAEDARTWLRRHYVSYPSYDDRDGRLAADVGARVGLPTTVFYDRSGEVAYISPGPYRTDAALEADLQRYVGAVPDA
jgi:thiol-disulfide isomerase/thioredoxin